MQDGSGSEKVSDNITHEWECQLGESANRYVTRTGGFMNSGATFYAGACARWQDLRDEVRTVACPGTHRIRTLDPNVDIIVRIPEGSDE